MNSKYLLLSIITTCLVILASAIPSDALWKGKSASTVILFNLAHIPGYGLLAWSWLKTFDVSAHKSRFLLTQGVIVTSLLLFSVSDELHQLFTPGRSASYTDLCLDAIGILCGLTLFRYFVQTN